MEHAFFPLTRVRHAQGGRMNQPRASRTRGARRVLKEVRDRVGAEDNNQPNESLALQLDNPAVTPPPTYRDHESETGSVASRSPKSRASGSAHGSSSASSIYDYLDALETESALQLDLARQTGHRELAASAGAPPSYERSHRGDAWNESADAGRDGLPSPTGSNISSQSGASNAYYVEIKAKLATMTIELNDKTKTIELLKAARKKDKAKTRQLLAAAEDGHKEQLKLQQLKFEKELEQHLDFAQSLVSDKAALAKRCDELVAELQKASATAAREAERSKMQLKDARDRWMTQEKTRRDQWIAKKTEEIKKSTVSALEPDIQLILARGKAELERAQEAAAEERRKLQQQLEKDKEAALQRLKDECERRLVDAREKERVKLVARLDAADAELQQQLSAQRRRLQEEAEVVRTELGGELRALKAAHAQELAAARTQASQAAAAASEQAKQERQELARKLDGDLAAAREQSRAEAEQFKSHLTATLRQEAARDKQALEAQMLQARDAQIELVIDKLAEEGRQRVEAAEQRALRQLEQERQLWERQRRQTSEVEGAWMDKNRELHDKLGRLEAALKALRSERDEAAAGARQAGDELAELARRLQEERRQHESAAAQLETRCAALQADGERARLQQAAESAALRDRAAQMEACFQEQARRLQGEHEAALGGLHERVRATVARKDQAIAALQEDALLLRAKLDKSHALIEDQRRQLFSDC